ncbi:unnamed protein product [Withania somnifera]
MDIFSDKHMYRDLLLQATLILITIFMFLWMYNIPQKYLNNLRLGNRANIQSKRHFVQGAQFLSQAKSSKDRSQAISLAKSAESQADLAISLDPKDAAAHILKALALDLQGADALFKRAQLKLGVSRRGRVDSVIEDLKESLRLKGDNVKAFCLLGDCYEKMGLKEEAQKTYQEAQQIQPNYAPAQEALDRLKSVLNS